MSKATVLDPSKLGHNSSQLGLTPDSGGSLVVFSAKTPGKSATYLLGFQLVPICRNRKSIASSYCKYLAWLILRLAASRAGPFGSTT